MTLPASRARQRLSVLIGSDVVSLESIFLLLAVCIIQEVVFVITGRLVSGTGFINTGGYLVGMWESLFPSNELRICFSLICFFLEYA